MVKDQTRRGQDPAARHCGIALIIVSSLLVLLAVAAVSLLSLASGLRQRSAVNIDHETARLLARSGAAYAYSRLTNPFARAEAADDWAFRDPPETPLEAARNPSYAHGEPYADRLPNGRYDEGIDTYTDLNANGRYDAWSGRLRGRHGLADATFALKIASSESRIDVNGGTVSAQDTDNNAVPDCRDWVASDPFSRRSSPWWSVKGMPAIHNVHGSDVIDLLGEVIYDTEHGTPEYPVAAANAWLASAPTTSLMQVGRDLIKSRPPGGYRDIEEARRLVAPEDWARIGPYLSTRGSRTGSVWGKKDTYGHTFPQRFDRVQAVDVNTADRYLLAALFLRYQYAPIRLGTPNIPAFTRRDTERIADFLIQNRPFASRYDLFRKLDAAKTTVFPAPAFDPLTQNQAVNLAALVAEGNPGAFYPLETGTTSPSSGVPPEAADFLLFSWATYDLPRNPPPAPQAGIYETEGIGEGGRQLRFNIQLEPPVRYRRGGVNLNEMLFYAQLLPLSLDSGDPSSFSMESLGRIGAAGGRRALATLFTPSARILSILQATSQDDFENREESLSPPDVLPDHPYDAGEYVWLRSPGGRRLEGGVELRGWPAKLRTQTWPGYSPNSCPEYVQGSELTLLYSPSPAGWFSQEHIGNVALMPYAGRLYDGEFFYMPCWEKGGENGQPLRDPVAPASAKDNFANLVSDPASEQGIGLYNGTTPSKKGRIIPWTPAVVPDLLARRPTTVPLTSHQWAFADFPWFGPGGGFQGGTCDYWGIIANLRLVQNPDAADYLSAGIDSTLFGETVALTIGSNSYRSAGSYAPHTPHRVTLVFAHDRLQGYVDGIPDSGLADDNIQANAPASGWKPTFLLESGMPIAKTVGDLGGGIRAFAEPWAPDKIRASASQDPYFWTAEAHPDVPGIPSYTSPLYVFPAPARLTSASWDGFVPAKIRDADPGSAPLRVELLMYPDEWAVPGTEKILPLPAEGWRTGGESVSLEKEWGKLHAGERPPAIRSFRYRIWFDSSAMGGVGNETPVFNSIRVAYRGGHPMEGMAYEQGAQ